MFEVQLPAFRKYQNIAGIAAGVGFVLGLLIPAFAIFTARWACPFGDGWLRIGGFLLLTGLGSAIVFGNLVAVFLIGCAKRRRGKPAHRTRKKNVQNVSLHTKARLQSASTRVDEIGGNSDGI